MSDTYKNKEPLPYKPDYPDHAEAFILAAMFNPENIPAVLQTGIVAEDFYPPYRKTIFREAVALYEVNPTFDIVTFADILDKKGHLAAVGGHAGFMEATMHFSSTFHVEEIRQQHVDNIKAAARRRRAAVQLAEALDTLNKGDNDAFRKVQDIIAENEQPGNNGFKPFYKYAVDVMAELDEETRRRTYITGIRSGYFRLDILTAGFQPGNVYVIAARPSMGKTALALDIVRNVSAEPEKAPRVALVSAEMSAKGLMRRMIGAEAGIDLRQMVYNPTAGDFQAIGKATRAIKARTNIQILEAHSLDIDQIIATVRRAHATQPFGLVVVDYLQLLPATGQRALLSTVDQVTEVSKKLHAMAISLNLPVIALAQVNRDASGKNPTIRDLKGSGAIEQDADVVILLDRPERYTDDTMPADYAEAVKGLAVLDVAKNRNGATGKVCLTFQPETQRFFDRSDQTVPTIKPTRKQRQQRFALSGQSNPQARQ